MQIVKKSYVYQDSRHNAFTDLKYHNGYYYLAFRNGTSHLGKEADGQVIVMRSKDAEDWEKMEFPRVDGDVRDCKFLKVGNELSLLIPYRRKGILRKWNFGTLESKLLKGVWSEPEKLIDNWIAWRPKLLNDTLYIPVFWHGRGMDDYDNWKVGVMLGKKVKEIYRGKGANETELFSWNDEIYAIVRREGLNALLLCMKGRKFRWELPSQFQSPAVWQLTKDKFLIIGREFRMDDLLSVKAWLNAFGPDSIRDLDVEWCESIVMGVLDMKKGTLRMMPPLVEGKNNDCGYCGIEKKGKNLLVSFYDGWSDKSAIYIVEIKIEEKDLR